MLAHLVATGIIALAASTLPEEPTPTTAGGSGGGGIHSSRWAEDPQTVELLTILSIVLATEAF